MSQSWRIVIKSNPDQTLVASSKQVQNIVVSNSGQQSYGSASFDYFDFTKSAYKNHTIGTEVDIEINGVLVFEGFIASKRTTFLGDCIMITFNCVSHTYKLERYFTDANKTYTSKTTGYIVKDLLTTYTDLTHDDISSTDGVSVSSIVFDEVTLATAFAQLSELDGYRYYVGSKRT